jgi:hypothetical protein
MIIRGMLPRSREHLLHRELICAVERTRSRLAVAVAAERKFLAREIKQRYWETEDRMRRWLRQMRRGQGREDPRTPNCSTALAILNQPIPPADTEKFREAQILCERLYRVLEIVAAPEKDS